MLKFGSYDIDKCGAKDFLVKIKMIVKSTKHFFIEEFAITYLLFSNITLCTYNNFSDK